MKKIILNILDFLFARKILIPINTVVLKLVIRFLGYNNHNNINISGERNFLEKIMHNKTLLCIDVGANIGEYSKYILENSNSKVIAFEPMPSSFKKLKKIENIFNDRLYAYNIGIGDKNETKYLYYDKNNLQWANFNSELKKIDYLKKSNKSVKCKISTLDNFLFKNKKLPLKKIDLIKIDTEGYELEVLIGAKKTIKKFKPKYIQIEYNWHHLFKNVNLYYFSKILKEYQAYKILPFDKELMKINTEKPEHNYFNYSNIVFIKK
jgi:FkbM family methyltransferase